MDLVVICVLCAVACFRAIDAADSFPIEGRIYVPEGRARSAEARILLHLNDGQIVVGRPREDGGFVLHDVPSGTHMLDVDAPGLVYPQLRVDVSGRMNGAVTASYAENNRQTLPEPLLLKPLGSAQYFEVRKPFNPIAFLKSPMGMMLGFMLFAMYLLPKMKLDPEEMKQLMEAQAARGAQQGGQQAQPQQAQLPSSGNRRRRD